MKKAWAYIAAFFAGISAGMVIMVLAVKDAINNQSIQVTRPKIKNSPDGFQQIISGEKKREKKRLFKKKV
jgi:uncharacterized membrane-anchored protein YhcB (DUF1043 family)